MGLMNNNDRSYQLKAWERTCFGSFCPSLFTEYSHTVHILNPLLNSLACLQSPLPSPIICILTNVFSLLVPRYFWQFPYTDCIFVALYNNDIIIIFKKPKVLPIKMRAISGIHQSCFSLFVLSSLYQLNRSTPSEMILKLILVSLNLRGFVLFVRFWYPYPHPLLSWNLLMVCLNLQVLLVL